jgi:hypothetical protein
MGFARLRLVCGIAAVSCLAVLAAPSWKHLSSARGELPNPGGSHQQTGLLAASLDKAKASGFVIGYRVHGPALVWFRPSPAGWQRVVIEEEFLRLEAGGAAHDIDRDGDLDLVFGEDAQGSRLWWWENPYPDFSRTWKRRLIKDGGANQHHDQIFADVKGTGRPQLLFWNQKARTLFIADIPANPRNTEPWTFHPAYSGEAGERVGGSASYAEGLDAFDVDGDGRLDVLAGNVWLKHESGSRFQATRVDTAGGRIRAGRFGKGRHLRIVIAPGDGSGPLRIIEARGDPARSESWVGRSLLNRDMVHGHTLELGDIDGDGNLDIFAAEMAQWTNKSPEPDHPKAAAWILYGDDKGGFRTTVLVSGHDWHEGKLADVEGDGDLDVIGKPYTWQAPRIDLWLNGRR